MKRRAALGILSCALLLACEPAEESSTPAPVPSSSRTTYQAHVQPLMDQLCAQTACHGVASRPLHLYSRFSLRMPEHAREPGLVAAELDANIETLTSFLEGLPDLLDTELLTKPLRPEAGGVGHGGGAQFYDRADPAYVLLACWILGGGEEGGTACRP